MTETALDSANETKNAESISIAQNLKSAGRFYALYSQGAVEAV
ncbi:hypothetical protein [Helicobacter sp. 23-1045]